MKLQAIEDYREQYDLVARTHPFMREMMAELESELEGCVKLPRDAEGVPIHVGDRMEYAEMDEDDEPFDVLTLGFRSGGFDVYYDIEGRAVATSVTMASEIRHCKRPTVEDVLKEYHRECNGNGVARVRGELRRDADELTAEYADKVREAVMAE